MKNPLWLDENGKIKILVSFFIILMKGSVERRERVAFVLSAIWMDVLQMESSLMSFSNYEDVSNHSFISWLPTSRFIVELGGGSVTQCRWVPRTLVNAVEAGRRWVLLSQCHLGRSNKSIFAELSLTGLFPKMLNKIGLDYLIVPSINHKIHSVKKLF